MKKRLAVILITVLLFSMCLPAAAAENAESVKLVIVSQGNSGDNGCFRLVADLSSFPFEVSENSLAGSKITGTWAHKKTGEVVALDSTVKSNEMRTGQTVLVVNPTDTVKVSDLDYTTSNEYTYDFTLTRVQPVDVTNFAPFSISVTGTGSATGVKRILVNTADFPFAVTEANQLKGCLLNGTVTYSGTGNYSKSVPFENVKIVNSDVRANNRAGLDFVVPDGYTIYGSNGEDKNYTWNLTISPAPKEDIKTDLPENGTTFFVTPEMFKKLGIWQTAIDGGYNVLFMPEKGDKNDTTTAIRVPEAGTYGIYSFTKDYADNKPGTRYAKISVDGTEMKEAGKHGTTGYAWEKIGEMTFDAGQVVKVTFLKESERFSRTAALMFTTEADYRPSPEYFENTIKVGAAEMAYLPLSDSETNLMLLPADFSTDLGTWVSLTDAGYSILRGLENRNNEAKSATAKVKIPKDGVYYVWGLAKDYTSSSQGARAFKIGINGSVLPDYVGVHGKREDTGASGAYAWDLAGKVTLKAGTATVSLEDVNRNYARTAAILLTTDVDFSGMNPGDFEESIKYRAEVCIGELDFSNLTSYGNKLSYTLKNRTDKDINSGVIIAAIYDKDEILVDAKMQTLESPLQAGKSLEKTDITFEAASEWTNGKVMLWESMESMKPLRAPETFVYTPEDFANPDEGADKDFGTVTSYMLDYSYANTQFGEKEYNIRGGIYNTLKKLQGGEDVTIAYLGGSITQQETWRPKTTQWFEDNYSGKIREVNIGLSGTNADLAVCRIDRDILVHNPDLIFIEYAVNGGAAKDMEGMALKIWEQDPTIDICFVYTTQTSNYATYKSGNLPSFAAIYEGVAKHYEIPSVFFGYQAFDLYEQNKLTLSGKLEEGKVLYTTDGIHVTADGGWLAAGAIARCVTAMEKGFDANAYTIQNHTIPSTTHDAYPWKDADYCEDWSLMKFDGTWLDCSLDTATNNFKNYAYTGGYLSTFKQIFPKMTGTVVPGSSVTVKFKGTDLGIFEAGGQYSGQLRVIIDGVEQSDKMVLYHSSYDSKLRHQYYFIPTQAYGEHTVTFILDETMPDKSKLQNQNPTDTTYEKNELYIGKILVVGEVLNANE